MGWKSRESNYRHFRKNLDMPLVTVEMSFDGRFALSDTDADILIQVGDGDVLWQKERLLNIALDAVPDECKYVAWLDCDIVPDKSDWAGRICDALEECPLVQAFSRVWHVGRQQTCNGKYNSHQGAGISSLARSIQLKLVPNSLFSECGGSCRHGYSPGYAWAIRRELIKETQFYDALIMGSGDKAIYSAAYAKIPEFISAMSLGKKQATHFRNWAEPFSALINGNVGYAEADIFHLWHGDMGKRAYAERYNEFSRFEFDPAEDLSLGSHGAWRWGSRKPDMHRFVSDYLESRQEDG